MPARDAGAILGSAPWRRAPRLLLRRPAVLLSAAGATLVLVASMAAVPLFLSSAGTAALTTQRDERCSTSSGRRLPRHPDAEFAPFLAAVRETARTQPVLGEPILASRLNAETFLTTAATDFPVRVTVLTRTDFRDHLPVMESAGDDGLWLPDTLAAAAAVGAGGAVTVVAGDSTVSVPVAGVYASLAGQPLDDYWCGLASDLTPKADGTLPPPLVLVGEAALERLNAAFTGPENPFVPGEHGISVTAEGEMTVAEADALLDFYAEMPALIARRLGLPPPPTEIRHPPRVQRDGAYFPGFTQRVEENARRNDLPFMIGRSKALRTAVGGGVVPVAVAAVLAAAGMVVAAGALWADRRRHELAVLRARGIGPAGVSLKAALELLPAVVGGAAAGWAAAYAAVLLLGPSDRIEPDSIVQAVVLAVLGAAAALVLFAAVAAVRSGAEVRRSARRRFRLAVVPWETLVGGAAFLSYRRFESGGALDVDGAVVERVDTLALAFPLLFLAAGLAVIVRIVTALVRPRRSSRVPRRWSIFLARRRLVAGRAAAITFFAAAGLAAGVLLYGSTLTRSLTATLDAKLRTFAGSVTNVQLLEHAPVPQALEGRATAVVRMPGKTDRRDVEVLAIDPATFTDGAFWEASYAATSIEDLLERLSDDADGSVPAVAVGWDPGGEASVQLGSGDDTLDIAIVGDARLFPGATQADRVLVIPRAAIGELTHSLRAATEIWSTADEATVLAAVREEGLQIRFTRATERIFEQTTFLTVSWTFGFMQSLGVIAGLITIGGLSVYLDARRRARTLGYAFLRRMGLAARTHRRALFLEIAATILVGGLVGVALAVVAGWLVHGHLDPVPVVPPGTLLRVPLPLLAGTIAVAAAICAIGAGVAQRLADRDEPVEVLHAGT